LLPASHAPAFCSSEPSRAINGSIGVKAKRPTPIATANAIIATAQTVAGERVDGRVGVDVRVCGPGSYRMVPVEPRDWLLTNE